MVCVGAQSALYICYFLISSSSGYDTSKTTSCEFLVLYLLVDSDRTFQCVVGDSSTVCHGSKYLKKWLAWLDANADVKYAGLE